LTDSLVDVAGARLWTATTGVGRPVVLLHGGPGGHDDLGPLASMIDDTHVVHRFDQRACGRSSGGPPFTLERWVADLEELPKHWGHDRWVVGGHSFGAELALAYAVTHPLRTEALIYISCLPEFGAGEGGREEYRANRLARIPEALRDRWLTLRSLRESGSKGWSPDEYARIGMLAEFHDPTLAREYTEGWSRIPVNAEVNTQLVEDFRTSCADPRFLDAVRRFDRPAILLHGENTCVLCGRSSGWPHNCRKLGSSDYPAVTFLGSRLPLSFATRSDHSSRPSARRKAPEKVSLVKAAKCRSPNAASLTRSGLEL
jgi:proline iminopeptidase